MERIIEDISLEELAEREYLSVRAVNICRSVDIKTLKDLVAFYEKDGMDFMRIRNCGAGTARMLLEVYKKYSQEIDVNEFKGRRGKGLKSLLKKFNSIESRINFVKNQIENEIAEKERLLNEKDSLTAANNEGRKELQLLKKQTKTLEEEIHTFKVRINARNRELLGLKRDNPHL